MCCSVVGLVPPNCLQHRLFTVGLSFLKIVEIQCFALRAVMHPGWSWVGTYEIKMAALTGKRAILTILGTLRSDDGDGNKNVEQAVGLMNKTTTLHMHHTFSTFLCRPCATRTWGNEKIPNFMFCGGRKQLSNHKIYFFLSELGWGY